MACVSCHSVNQRVFPAEINVHFPGLEGLDKPTVWLFPRLLVCLDCAFTQFTIPNVKLRQLSDSDPRSKFSSASCLTFSA
jgi:hypothetical protein